MTPQAALTELLARVSAENGAAVLVNDHELGQWPGEAVSVMKAKKLLVKARPASSAVCPGCERDCVMPVNTTLTTRKPAPFIVCDKRSDINRVDVPISYLEQWQASGDLIASLLADLLGLDRSGISDTDAARWEIGMLKGAKHSSHLVLSSNGRLTLTLAGHSVSLADVLELEGDTFKVDRRKLNRLVDRPVAGAGDTESAAKRRERLKKRVQMLQAKGTKAFLKAVASEEGISVSRLKQLLRVKAEPTNSRSS
jgi:hypothetical protein